MLHPTITDPTETEAYMFIALIYLIMYSDPYHISIAHLPTHNRIDCSRHLQSDEQDLVVVLIRKWRRMIKTNLALRTACVKSAIFPRMYFKYLKRLLLRYFASPLCVLTAHRLKLPLRLQCTEWRVRVQTALRRGMSNRVFSFTLSKFSMAQPFGIYRSPSDR
jgi:hypothetical protein